VEIPEEQIKEIFDTTKEKVTAIFEEFKKICLPTEITKLERDTPKLDENIESF
jgi:hypothetical protein